MQAGISALICLHLMLFSSDQSCGMSSFLRSAAHALSPSRHSPCAAQAALRISLSGRKDGRGGEEASVELAREGAGDGIAPRRHGAQLSAPRLSVGSATLCLSAWLTPVFSAWGSGDGSRTGRPIREG